MKLFSKSPASAKVLDLRGTKAEKPNRFVFKSQWLTIPLVVVITLGAVFGTQYFLAKPKPPGGQAGMKHAVAAVGRLMLLPTDETPTYGTVADKTKLSTQTFFKQAENGDEVLIYEKAQLTILYRPSINKIVNVGPVVSGKTGSPYITSRIAILNGSGSDDLLAKMTTQVTTAFPNAAITAKAPASRAYPTSIVADLSTKNQPLAEQVADTLAIQGGKLPLGEPAPEADLLIIIGADYK